MVKLLEKIQYFKSHAVARSFLGGLDLHAFPCSSEILFPAVCTERWSKDPKVKLRTAFSRDQSSKVYVQDLLREDADDIWHLLSAEKGAHLYVCGDARLMAMDVHRAILDIAIDTGGLSEQEAVDFVLNLESEDRYQKDVWIA